MHCIYFFGRIYVEKPPNSAALATQLTESQKKCMMGRVLK